MAGTGTGTTHKDGVVSDLCRERRDERRVCLAVVRNVRAVLQRMSVTPGTHARPTHNAQVVDLAGERAGEQLVLAATARAGDGDERRCGEGLESAAALPRHYPHGVSRSQPRISSTAWPRCHQSSLRGAAFSERKRSTVLDLSHVYSLYSARACQRRPLRQSRAFGYSTHARS